MVSPVSPVTRLLPVATLTFAPLLKRSTGPSPSTTLLLPDTASVARLAAVPLCASVPPPLTLIVPTLAAAPVNVRMPLPPWRKVAAMAPVPVTSPSAKLPLRVNASSLPLPRL